MKLVAIARLPKISPSLGFIRMTPSPSRLQGRLLPALLILSLNAIGGCGENVSPIPTVGETLPVSGHVTLNAKPLPGGMVILRPDQAKGNHSTLTPSGEIQPDGSYTLKSIDKPGAPAGWYKVTVISGISPTGAQGISIPQRYASETDTPLTIEVSAASAAGAYDLKLTK